MGSHTYNNHSDLGWVVQKFGGTSVGKFPDKVCYLYPRGTQLRENYIFC